MRILINAASANMGGAVTYLKNIIQWLPSVGPEGTYIVCAPAETISKLSTDTECAGIEWVTYPYDHTGGIQRLYFDQVSVPKLIRDHGADVLFSSTGFGTFASPCPQILLVRNPVYFSSDFHRKYRELGRSLRTNTIRRWHSILSARAADVILFPTHAMRSMVEAYTSFDRKPIRSIHYGFDRDVFTRTTEPDFPLAAQVADWKREGYHVLLNVSTYAVHKNFETLVEALPLLGAQGLKVKVLMTTSRNKTADKQEYDALMGRAHSLGVQDTIVELGYVPYTQLHALYQAADLYVFPSFTESFGHSLVEAMASGLPIVAADMPVNREVCGDAAAFFHSFDPADCAAQIQDVLVRPERRKRLAEAAAARSKQFSWKDYVESLAGIFREAAQNADARRKARNP